MTGHVVTQPPEPFALAGGAITVHAVPAWRDNLVWVLVDEAQRTACVVDGPEAAPVDAFCAEHGLVLTTIWNTHHHPDHVGLNAELQRAGRLEGLVVVGSAALAPSTPGITRPVHDGDVVRFGPLEATVWRTDGHVDGHITYVCDGAIFCGDTLFAGGCGYLFDGPPRAMFRSLLRLAGLPGATRVCCAHEYTEDNLRFAWTVEPDNEALAERIRAVWSLRAQGGCTVPSTLADERATNPFLRPGAPSLVAKVSEAIGVDDPADPVAVFAATRALKDRKDHKAVPDEALPLE